MSDAIIVHKGRVTTVLVNLGVDVTGDAITSEIRTEPDVASQLIASWSVTPVTDGTDGLLALTLDDSVSGIINYTNGYMDVKRVINGIPTNAFEEILQVVFKGVVTA